MNSQGINRKISSSLPVQARGCSKSLTCAAPASRLRWQLQRTSWRVDGTSTVMCAPLVQRQGPLHLGCASAGKRAEQQLSALGMHRCITCRAMPCHECHAVWKRQGAKGTLATILLQCAQYSVSIDNDAAIICPLQFSRLLCSVPLALDHQHSLSSHVPPMHTTCCP
jgi:hypothetical protein